MYVESFHRLLKYCYLQRKINKRVDTCIHVLLKIARDKGFERVIKFTKGKKSHRFLEIQKRHTNSCQMSAENVCPVGINEWRIKSTCSEKHVEYTVTEEHNECTAKCMLICKICNVCVHQFACTCPDYTVNGNMCKHIHLVVSTSITILID
jgi:hypothetical protein